MRLPGEAKTVAEHLRELAGRQVVHVTTVLDDWGDGRVLALHLQCADGFVLCIVPGCGCELNIDTDAVLDQEEEEEEDA